MNQKNNNNKIKHKSRYLSERLHKYPGLILCIVLLYMSISGILLNHPDLIKNYNWPGFLLPHDMQVRNWGRGAVLTVIPYKNNTIAMGGKLGVFLVTSDQSIKELNNGLPHGVIQRTVNVLYYDTKHDILYAGLNSGLYRLNNHIKWEFITEGNFRFLDRTDLGLTAVSDNRAYIVTKKQLIPINTFKREGIASSKGKMPAINYFFKLHSGQLLGLPGKLIIDITGLIIIILSISGAIIWFRPKKKRKVKILPSKLKKLLTSFHIYHFKYGGILLIIPFLVIPVTGFFMRPPFIMILAGKHIDTIFAEPAPAPGSWNNSIQKVLHDKTARELYIVADNKIFKGPSDFSKNFKVFIPNIPVHPMGIRSFNRLNNGQILIGSFSGLLRCDKNDDKFYDYFTGKLIRGFAVRKRGPYQVNETAKIHNKIVVMDYRKGLYDLETGAAFITMPEQFTNRSTFSLWNFMFELHNGRFFKSFIGKFYILHNPLVAIFMLVVILSGYIILKRRKIIIKKKNKLKQEHLK